MSDCPMCFFRECDCWCLTCATARLRRAAGLSRDDEFLMNLASALVAPRQAQQQPPEVGWSREVNTQADVPICDFNPDARWNTAVSGLLQALAALIRCVAALRRHPPFRCGPTDRPYKADM